MKRRHFLAGAGAVAASSGFVPTIADAQSPSVRFALAIVPKLVELVDGSDVFMLAFSDQSGGAKVPGPVLRAREGDLVEITIRNTTDDAHEFAIPGALAGTGPIPPRSFRTASFIAPAGGTYLYLDPSRAPVNRVLGLHGVLVVAPGNGLTAAGSPTPYSRAAHTAALSELFDALGGPVLPGEQWNPDDPKRERIWLFHQIDPRFNDMARRGVHIDPADMLERFLPRYFTINGQSGFDAGEDKSIVPSGYVGEPVLLRTLNAGLVTHSPHIHGNDVFELSTASELGAVVVDDNIIQRDTWALPPLARKDILLAFYRPTSIPDAAFPPREEPFPLRYVMHCHTEMSQTAGGGSYPQGAVTHWELLGVRRAV
jgi:hypothetical protein